MDDKAIELCGKVIPAMYAAQAKEARNTVQKQIQQLIDQRTIPDVGWNAQTIEIFLNNLAMMDSNNFLQNCGVGEREGRVLSQIVARRNFNFAHGIGRSGDILEVQPKAAGSSVLYRTANDMMLQFVKKCGILNIEQAFILPVATGMCLTLVMLALRNERPNARYVIWSRIDQKAVLKSIFAAALQPIVVDTVQRADALVTDVDAIRNELTSRNPDEILCVLTTTSCFAPREPDNLVEVASLCRERGIPHIVNNAYGLQSTRLTALVNEALRTGRIDAVVHSTDKNLLVPVGGSILCGSRAMLAKVAQTYPGRASSAPIVDAIITLLEVGWSRFSELIRERKSNFEYLRKCLQELAAKHGLRVLESPRNPISIAVSLDALTTTANADRASLTELGGVLFKKCVSGARVIVTDKQMTVNGLTLRGFGSSTSRYSEPYMTAAAALGVTHSEVDEFIKRLDKSLLKFSKLGASSSSSSSVTKEMPACSAQKSNSATSSMDTASELHEQP